MSALFARVHLQRGAFTLDVELRAEAGVVTSVFGPSGAGKTTLLRCVAGLEPAARGRVTVGEQVWQDETAFVPTHRRAVGYVFQEAGLFPHLDVAGNLRYAARRATDGGITLDDATAWLGLQPLLARRPASLSGGERQRVAIARALLIAPRVLLLDEPLSALDEPSRRQILPYLEALPQRLQVPIVYVGHGVREVARLCDRMLWLANGRVHAEGDVPDLLTELAVEQPADDDLGAVLAGTVTHHDDEDLLTELAVAGGSLLVRRLPHPIGTVVRVQIPARDVSIALDPEPRSSILNVLPARVVDLHPTDGGQVVVRLATDEGAVLLARITRRSQRALALASGAPVYARVKSVSLLRG